MIYVLYSNDYEVYLGGNYCPESQVLIDTTERVLSACEDIGVPMTLFCDLLCLWRYRELGHPHFPDTVDQQLQYAVRNGHDVQAHIHPHWLETEIIRHDDGASAYRFDLSKFLLANCVPEGGTPLRDAYADLFARAKSYLEELLCPVNPDYRCIAFRAGGYGIQPNTEELFAALIDAGYVIDSSIVPGMLLRSNVNRVDFANVPRRGNYFISPERGLERVAEEGIFEVPVLALRPGEASWLLAKSFVREVVSHVLKRTKYKQLGYTIQSTNPTEERRSLLDRIRPHLDSIRRGWFMLELCPDTSLMVEAARRYINRYHRKDDCDLYFSVSCHSKSINPVLLNALNTFHRRLDRIYGEQLQSITFQEAGHHLRTRRKQDS